MAQYKKGNTYTLREFLPVLEAAMKAWPNQIERPLFFRDIRGFDWKRGLYFDNAPFTLLVDVPDGTPEPPKQPKTVNVQDLTADVSVYVLHPLTKDIQKLNPWHIRDIQVIRLHAAGGGNLYASREDAELGLFNVEYF